MNDYLIQRHGGQCGITISGDTVQSAVDSKLHHVICEVCPNIGNAAGYTLNRVWFERQSEGKTKLHVIATGNDGLIGYDPTTDIPKEYVIEISGLQENELPEQEEVALVEPEPFNPMTCETDLPEKCLGALKAIVDELAKNHCLYTHDNPPSRIISVRFPNMEQVNTPTYISQMMLLLTRSRPKKTKEANELLDRAEELVSALANVRSLSLEAVGRVMLYYYQGRHYFSTNNKITALAKHRQEAGLTQKQLAEAVGISTRQLAAYENPRTTSLGSAKTAVVQKLANVLGVKVDDLVRDGLAVRVDAD